METRLFCMVPGTGFNGGQIGCSYGGHCSCQNCPHPGNYKHWEQIQTNQITQPSQEYIEGVQRQLEEFEQDAMKHVCCG